jgi:large subunit ribosomal protein L1
MKKRHTDNCKLIDDDTRYPAREAFELVGRGKAPKFDESVDVAIRLGIDPKKSDQMVRGSVRLPNGLGKNVRVVVFAKGDKVQEAEAAGAEHVGADELIEKISKGWFDFDKAVATPDMMGAVSKIGKLLGPRGLMPNPKLGTVTTEVGKAVEEVKAGRVEFRVEKGAIVHAPLGRRSFGAEKLEQNFAALVDAIVRAKPAAAKGHYLKGISVSTTMGPGIAIDTAGLQ